MVNWKNDQKWHCGPTKKYQRRLDCRSATKFSIHWEQLHKCLRRNGTRWCGRCNDNTRWVWWVRLPLAVLLPFLLICPWPCSSPSFHLDGAMQAHSKGYKDAWDTIPAFKEVSIWWNSETEVELGMFICIFVLFCLKANSDKIAVKHGGREALFH